MGRGGTGEWRWSERGAASRRGGACGRGGASKEAGK